MRTVTAEDKMTVTLSMMRRGKKSVRETVPAVFLTEHFAVHGKRGLWGVTHRRTGRRLPFPGWLCVFDLGAGASGVPRKDFAIKWARLLEALPIPWGEVQHDATGIPEQYRGHIAQAQAEFSQWAESKRK